LILAGDNDEAGRDMNERFGRWAAQLRFENISYIDWPTDFREGGDTTDLLAAHGGDVHLASAQFVAWMEEYKLPQFEDHIDTEAQIVELEDLRGTGPDSIYGWETNFLDTYHSKKRHGRGRLLLLAVPPGAGKTHTSVRVIEERAKTYLERRKKEYEALESQLESLSAELDEARDPVARDELAKSVQKVKIKLDEFSFVGFGWFGQYINQWADLQRIGIDESLWMDFQARNPDNCGNFEVVKQLGQQHHNIGAFCNNGCPLREMCKKNGYLAQEEERKKKPIIFFRHGNLPQREMVSECRELIVIDENPTGLFEQSLEIKAANLYPFFPDREAFYKDDQDYQRLTRLLAAVRAAMSVNDGAPKDDPKFHIYGASFFRLVDEQLGLHDLTLQEVLDGLRGETLELHQPNFLSGSNDAAYSIPLRCVPDLVKVMQRELPAYIVNPFHEAPSTIHLISGSLVVFPMDRLLIPTNIPIIVADGTAMPKLYEAMFNREVEFYRPEIRNPNCDTIIIGNSDWLKSVFNRQVGHIVQKIRRAEESLRAKSAPNQPINMDDLPIDDAFESKFMEEAAILIRGVAEENDKLLVISYKDLRLLLEGHLEKTHPHLKGKIAWGHYGAMRGTNMFEDFPAVLLIGAFRIPYDQAYLYISMWAFLLGVENKIESETIVKKMPYDGMPEYEYEYRTFADPFADQYVNSREQAEMRQSVERIRPHATKQPKRVYVAAGRPAIKAVTQVIPKKKFLDRYRVTKNAMLLAYHRKQAAKSLEMFGEVRFPPFRQVREEFHTSNAAIKEVRAQVLAELVDKTNDELV
jgi:hypothetical protein